jgi:hypothetical protein
MRDKLIRRDTPLMAGDKIEVHIVTAYTLDVDDWLDGEQSVTVAEIEDWLRGRGKARCYRSILEGLRDEGYGGEFVEHTITPTNSDYDYIVRFELEWEQEERTRPGFERGYALVKPEQYTASTQEEDS